MFDDSPQIREAAWMDPALLFLTWVLLHISRGRWREQIGKAAAGFVAMLCIRGNVTHGP